MQGGTHTLSTLFTYTEENASQAFAIFSWRHFPVGRTFHFYIEPPENSNGNCFLTVLSLIAVEKQK